MTESADSDLPNIKHFTKTENLLNNKMNNEEITNKKKLTVKNESEINYQKSQLADAISSSSSQSSEPHFETSLVRCLKNETKKISSAKRELNSKIIEEGETRLFDLIRKKHFLAEKTCANYTSKIKMKHCIPQGRIQIDYISKQCRIFENHQGGPYKMPPKPPWLSDKLSESTPYDTNSLDYFESLYVNQSDGHNKKY